MIATISSSAARSAAVTGDRSGFVSTTMPLRRCASAAAPAAATASFATASARSIIAPRLLLHRLGEAGGRGARAPRAPPFSFPGGGGAGFFFELEQLVGDAATAAGAEHETRNDHKFGHEPASCKRTATSNRPKSRSRVCTGGPIR